MEIEYRAGSAPTAAGQDSRQLTGVAIRFDSTTMIGSPPWGFRETIKPQALNKTLADGAKQVVLLDNHDMAKPLARVSAGNLTLQSEPDGLHFDATTADTSYASDVLANVKAGNIAGCSFGFRVLQDTWTEGDDGVDERVITELQLFEVSVCTMPAYQDTSVSARDTVAAAMEARARFLERALRAKYTADQLAQMLKDGTAFKNPNGDPSFPIADKEDLQNAIKAVGRAGGDHDAVRKYIIGRAKALGLEDLIPDNWNADGTLKSSAGQGTARDLPLNTDAPVDSEDLEAEEDADAEQPRCPGCGQFVTADAETCPSCDTDLPARAAGAGEQRADDAAQSLAAIDAALDEAVKLFAAADRDALPAEVNQGIDLVTGAWKLCAGAMADQGVPDPDANDGDGNGNDYEAAGYFARAAAVQAAYFAA